MHGGGKHLIGKNSILRRWIFSYLLILLIPLLGAVTSYAVTRSAVMEEMDASNRMLLAGLRTSVDDVFSQMDQTMTSLVVDEQLRTLIKTTDYEQLLAQLPDVVKSLYSRQFPIDEMEILVYLTKFKYLVTANTANSLYPLHAALTAFGKTGISFEQYAAQFEADYPSGVFLVSDSLTYKHPGTELVVLARTTTFALTRSNTMSASIFVSIPLDRISGLFTNDYDSIFLILDQNGAPLYAYNANGVSLPENYDAVVNNERSVFSIGGKTFVGLSVPSEVCDWRFMILTPEDRFWARADYVSSITAISLIAAMLIGLFSTLVLLRHNYQPVRKLLESVQSDQTTQQKSEFDIIRDSYAQLNHAHQNIRRALMTRQETFQENYLFARLHGKQSYLSDADMQEFLQLDFAGKRFSIVSFFREPPEAASAADDWQLREAEDTDAAVFALNSMFMSLFGRLYVNYHFAADKLITFLVILDEDQVGDFEREVDRKLDAMLLHLKEKLGQRACAILGETIPGISLLPQSYQSILDAAEYLYVTNESGVLHASSLKGAGADAADVGDVEMLCDALRIGHEQDAQRLLNALIGKNLHSGEVPFYIARFRAFAWVHALLSCQAEAPEQVMPLKRRLQCLIECENAITLSEELSALIRLLCGESLSVDQSASPLSQRVEQYVDTHYSDVNLSIGMIAEAMSLSPKYLSRLFRSEANYGLLDYINTVRIRHAKELMSTAKWTLGEIAQKVGYANIKTFRRAFVKIEGIMPSRYECGQGQG